MVENNIYRKDNTGGEVKRPIIIGLPVPENESGRGLMTDSGMTVEQLMAASVLDLRKIYPFLFAALYVIPRIESSEVGAISVSMDKIYYNSHFLSKITRPQLTYYLIHGLYHILMRHHLRGAGKEPFTWNKACDLYINKCIQNAFDADPTKGKTLIISPEGEHVFIDMPEGELFDEGIDIETDTPESIYMQLMEEQKDDQESNDEERDENSDDPGPFGKSGKGGTGDKGSEGDQGEGDKGEGSADDSNGKGGEQDDQGEQESDNSSDESNSENTDNKQSSENESSEAGSSSGNDINDQDSSHNSGSDTENQNHPDGDGNNGNGQGQSETKGNTSDNPEQSDDSGKGADNQNAPDDSGDNGNDLDNSPADHNNDGTGNSGKNSQDNESSSSDSDGSLKDNDAGSDMTGRMDLIDDADSQKESSTSHTQKMSRLLSKIKTIDKQMSDAKQGRGMVADPVAEAEIRAQDINRMNWRVLIRNKLIAVTTDEKDLSHPDRRFVHKGLYLEGPVIEEDQLSGIKLCVDTSASISDVDIQVALLQIEDLLKSFNLNAELVFWDEEIEGIIPFTDSHEFRLGKKLAKGRGGTNPDCIFEAFEQTNKRGHTVPKPSLVIIFTDGYFDPPNLKYKRAFANNTIWVLSAKDSVNESEFNPGFGNVVLL